MQTRNSYAISTEELANQLGLKPPAIRVRVNRYGSYYGITPKKLPNGRLLWPEDSAQLLIKFAEEKAA